MMVAAAPCMAQTRTLSGVVVDGTGHEPLPGATVMVKGSRAGSVSGADGRFGLSLPHDSTVTLQVSYVGYRTCEVHVKGDFVRVEMRPDVTALDGVTVQVAYGRQARRALTGAVSVVSADEIERRTVSSVASVLNGLVPGVQVADGIGQPGAEPTLRIRGYSSVNGSNAPLIVVDGAVYSGWITDINPADVESVSVLKDAASCALYGSRASNGVVLITTRRAKGKGVRMRLDVRHGTVARGQGDYERMGTDRFMEAMWQGYRNQLVSGGLSEADAAERAQREIISQVGINIYNKADDKLFDGNGRLVEDARVLDAYAGDLDWYGPYTRNGKRQEYNVSGQTAGEKSNMRFSLGYLDEEGFTRVSDFSRWSGRIGGEITPCRRLKAGMSLAATHQECDNDAGAGWLDESQSNPFWFARRIAPIYPVHAHYPEDVYAADGTLLHARGDYMLDASGNPMYDDGTFSRNNTDAASVGNNIIWESEKNSYRNTGNTVQAQAYATLSLPYGLSLSLRGHIGLRTLESRKYYNAEIGAYKGVGAINMNKNKHKEYTWQQMLTWQRSFGDHSVELLAGHENYDLGVDMEQVSKQGENFPGVAELSNFTTTTVSAGQHDSYRTEGWLARARYNYMNRYFAEASVRRDGSSVFHKDCRWGTFWSAGLGWMVSDEAFMRDVSWVDRLKARMSYGSVGNDNAAAGYYKWMALYGNATYGGEAAYFKIQNESPDLKWETNSSFNIGVEARLFDRVNVSFDYFDKRSDDLLFLFTQPLSAGATDAASGTSTVWRNVGEVKNYGWELSADADVVRSRDWTWNVRLNLYKVRNKIGRLPEKDREEGILSGDYHKLAEGRSIYEFWLYQYAGVDRLTGRGLFQADLGAYYPAAADGRTPAIEGDVTEGRNPIPESDWVNIGGNYYSPNLQYARKDWSGSALPKLSGAFSTSLRWRDVSLSVQLNFSLGAKVLDCPYHALTSVGRHALSTDLQNAWTAAPEGKDAAWNTADRIDPDGIPQLNLDATVNGFSSQIASTRYIESGDYLSIKNVTLAWRLPASWTRALTLSDVRLYGSVENAAIFTSRKGLNPTQTLNGVVANNMSIARVWSLGLSVDL